MEEKATENKEIQQLVGKHFTPVTLCGTKWFLRAFPSIGVTVAIRFDADETLMEGKNAPWVCQIFDKVSDKKVLFDYATVVGDGSRGASARQAFLKALAQYHRNLGTEIDRLSAYRKNAAALMFDEEDEVETLRKDFDAVHSLEDDAEEKWGKAVQYGEEEPDESYNDEN